MTSAQLPLVGYEVAFASAGSPDDPHSWSPKPSGSATFSECGRYRYRLDRMLAAGRRTMSVTMLNPSKAGADANDPTLSKLLGFCERIDVGRLIVTNLAALVSTDPRGLVAAEADVVGPECDRHIIAAAGEADLLVVAWGAGADYLSKRRVHDVLDLLRDRARLGGAGREVWCWGLTKHGHPRHPLMLPYATELELYAVTP